MFPSSPKEPFSLPLEQRVFGGTVRSISKTCHQTTYPSQITQYPPSNPDDINDDTSEDGTAVFRSKCETWIVLVYLMLCCVSQVVKERRGVLLYLVASVEIRVALVHR